VISYAALDFTSMLAAASLALAERSHRRAKSQRRAPAQQPRITVAMEDPGFGTDHG
jgi:hypothetical protein